MSKLMKGGILLMLATSVTLISCDALKQAASTILSNEDVGAGLKEALNVGVVNGADALAQKGGYFNSAYKILLPPEAQQVTSRLKFIPGFSDVENQVLKKINAGAEDAAVKAKPIFLNAIQQMTFEDAMGILMGGQTAATTYLKSKTYDQLYAAFQPQIITSLDQFDARKYWGTAVNAYNKIPLLDRVNPSLDDYVTKEALKGLFTMVENKEKAIRTDQSQRTSDLLKRVFAKQDK